MEEVIRIPMLAPSLNGKKGMIRMHHHVYSRIRYTWTLLVRGEWRGKKTIPGPVQVHILRRYAYHALDLDNLYAAAKVPLDALRKARVIIEDDPTIVTNLTCEQEKVPRRRDQETVITIRPVAGSG